MFNYRTPRFGLATVLAISLIFINSSFASFSSTSNGDLVNVTVPLRSSDKLASPSFRRIEGSDNAKRSSTKSQKSANSKRSHKPLKNTEHDSRQKHGFSERRGNNAKVQYLPKISSSRANNVTIHSETLITHVKSTVNQTLETPSQLLQRSPPTTNLELKLYGGVLFRINVIKVIGQILVSSKNQISLNQHASLNLIMNTLALKQTYTFRVLKILKRLQLSDRKGQFRMVMAELANNVPPYVQCACKYWVDEIDHERVEIHRSSDTMPETSVFLVGMDQNVIDACASEDTNEEQEPFDEVSVDVKKLLGPAFVSIYYKLKLGEVQLSQKMFGAILMNLPLGYLDPVLEEYIEYIWVKTQHYTIPNWNDIEPNVEYGRPVDLILSVIKNLLRHGGTPSDLKRPLRYLLLHLKEASTTYPDEYPVDMREFLNNDGDLSKLFYIIQDDSAIPELIELRDRLIEYTNNENIRNILQGMNKFIYRKPIDLLIAVLVRLQGRIPEENIAILITKILSILVVEKELYPLSITVPANVDLVILLNFLHIPNSKPEISELGKKIQLYLDANLELLKDLSELIPKMDKTICHRPLQCLVYLLIKIIEPDTVQQLRVPSTLILMIKKLLLMIRDTVTTDDESNLYNLMSFEVLIILHALNNVDLRPNGEEPESEIPGMPEDVFRPDFNQRPDIGPRPEDGLWSQEVQRPEDRPKVEYGQRPDFGPRPEDGPRPDFGLWPDDGQWPEHTPKVEYGQRPDFGPRPEDGLIPDFGPRPEDGPRPDFGPRPEDGPRPDFGPRPEDGPRPDFGPRPEDGPRPDFGLWPDDDQRPEHTPKVEYGQRPDFGPRPEDGLIPDFGPRPEDGPRPDFGPRPEDGPRPDFGLWPDDGQWPEHTPKVEYGQRPDFGPRPEDGLIPDFGPRPEDGPRPDFGLWPDDGQRPEYTPKVEYGQRPDFGPRPEDGLIPDFGLWPDDGQRPDFGLWSEHGLRPDFGQKPEYGPRPDPNPRPHSGTTPRPFDVIDKLGEEISNVPILPPNINFEVPFCMIFPQGDAPPYISPQNSSDRNDEGTVVEFPPMTILLQNLDSNTDFNDNKVPEIPNISKTLELIFGINYVEVILGRIDKSRYPTMISLLYDILIHALTDNKVMKNPSLVSNIQAYMKAIDYLSITSLLSVVVQYRNIRSDVLYITFDPDNPKENSVDSRPPQKIPYGFKVIPVYHPKYLLQHVDPVDPYGTLIPKDTHSDDNPIQELIIDGSLQDILGYDFNPLSSPNKATLLVKVLHKLIDSDRVASNPKLMQKVIAYLLSIKIVSLFTKISDDYTDHLVEMQPDQGTNWQPETISLIVALPQGRNQDELNKLWIVKAFLAIPNLIEVLGIGRVPYSTTRGELLKMIFDAAISGKGITLDQPTLDALVYFRNKIMMKGLGALPVGWVYMEMIIISDEIPLGEIIQKLVDFNTLPQDMPYTYNEVVQYLADNPNLLQGNGDFAFEQYTTKGTFLKGLFTHFLDDNSLDSNFKMQVRRLLPYIKETGPGAERLTYTRRKNTK